jgi:hypothetical protein
MSDFNSIAEEIESVFVLEKLLQGNIHNLKIPEELSSRITKLDFNSLECDELKRLGFAQWKLAKDSILYLVPDYIFDSLPDGIELISIFNEKAIKGQNKIDRDTRGGCIAFGLLRQAI